MYSNARAIWKFDLPNQSSIGRTNGFKANYHLLMHFMVNRRVLKEYNYEQKRLDCLRRTCFLFIAVRIPLVRFLIDLEEKVFQMGTLTLMPTSERIKLIDAAI